MDGAERVSNCCQGTHWSARGSAWCWTQIHSLSGLETVRIRSADPELVCADLHLGAAPPSEACGAGLLGSMAILFELSLSFFSFVGPVVSNCPTQQLSDTGLAHAHWSRSLCSPARTARHPTRLGFSHPAGGITRGPWDRQGLSRVASAMFLALQEE